MRRALAGVVAVLGVFAVTSAASAHVLLVGTYHGVHGKYKSIQAAVNAAKPDDWILIGPGDYKEHSGRAPAGRPDVPAGVLITKPGIYLRGMNRNTVIVDGTKPGSSKCSNKPSAQEFGPAGTGDSGPLGLNGIMVWKARDVWVQNLTACNYLHGSGSTGNEIWWNGGDGTSKVGGFGYLGSYLNTTSTYYKDEMSAAQYGIFSSNWSGGTWYQTYASNFNDSGYYIGACQQICNQVVDKAHAQYNALGYSGSNSGGQLVIKRSEFDHNKDGFDTNSQNGDNPPPQDGACPKSFHHGISPITHTTSCWVFMNNYVHDNNNPNVPASGSAAAGPNGTGMSVSGGRNDTIMNNRFEHNNAWGVIFVPYPDSGPPCTGGTGGQASGATCNFDEWGLALLHNKFGHNGGFGHPTNGDFAQLNLESGHPVNCYRGNTEEGGGSVTSSPANLQQTNPNCDGSAAPSNPNGPFLNEVLCDSGVELVAGVPPQCPTGPYPQRTKVNMPPLPKGLPTMPNPCAGVPANPWCRPHKKH